MNARDYERARSALAFIPPDDRDVWVSMGMAIKDGFGDEGFNLWDAWSRQSDRYDERDARDVWRSLEAGGGITLGTLFHEAKARGWRDDGAYQKPTPEEIEARRREAAERTAKEEAEKVREHAEAASKARALWADATSVHEAHPYLVRKGVSPVPFLREIDAGAAADVLGYAAKYRDKPLVGRLLVVPIKVAGKLSTLELIDEGGHKAVLSGGKKSSGFWAAQPLPDGDGTGVTLLIGEGVATVLSAKEAMALSSKEPTGHPAMAALTDTNLPKVAKAMRKRYPKAVMVVLADLVKTTGKPDRHAVEAARAVGGRLAVPDFGEDRPSGMTDFNDLQQLQGLEAVAECIRRQVFSKDGVTGVTGVQARRNAGSSCYTTERPGVTGVTEPAEDPASDAKDPASDAEDQASISSSGDDRVPPPLSKRPCFRVFDEWTEAPPVSSGPGCGSSASSKQRGPRNRRSSLSSGCARLCTSMP